MQKVEAGQKMGWSVKALRMEQHRAKVMEMYERYRQGATYEQIAQEYYYAGGNVISRLFFKGQRPAATGETGEEEGGL